MKIAMIHSLVGIREGGSETIVKNLSYNLADKGHEIDIYTNNGDIRFKNTVNVHRIPHIPVPFNRRLNYLSLMITFSLFSSLKILFRKYDIVHGFFYVDSYMPFLITKLKKTKSVFTFCGVLDKESSAGKIADKCIALNKNNKNIYSGLNVNGIEIIPNGVDIEKFARNFSIRKKLRKKYKLGDKFVVLSVSRPDEIKDPQLLHDIIMKTPGVIFILVGISELEPLKSMKAKNVIKLGSISNQEVRKYYSVADAFILTSKSEGFPGVLLEAMGCGLPVITTKIGGTKDLVNKDVGFFIERDAKKSSETIKILKNNRRLMKKISENCVAYVKDKYSWMKIAEQYENIYKEQINE